LLKALFAMPEYALLGRETKGKVEDFLDAWSLKEKPQEYRNALEHRQFNAVEIQAGYWFGEWLGLTPSYLQDEDVEAVGVVRTALLARMFGGPDATIENQIQFATLLESIRAMTPAKRNKALASADLSDVPPEFCRWCSVSSMKSNNTICPCCKTKQRHWHNWCLRSKNVITSAIMKSKIPRNTMRWYRKNGRV
jgi:hypothetical protein